MSRHEAYDLFKALCVIAVFSLLVLFHVVRWFSAPRYSGPHYSVTSENMGPGY